MLGDFLAAVFDLLAEKRTPQKISTNFFNTLLCQNPKISTFFFVEIIILEWISLKTKCIALKKSCAKNKQCGLIKKKRKEKKTTQNIAKTKNCK